MNPKQSPVKRCMSCRLRGTTRPSRRLLRARLQADEIQSAVRVAESASRHGVRTHNGIKG